MFRPMIVAPMFAHRSSTTVELALVSPPSPPCLRFELLELASRGDASAPAERVVVLGHRGSMSAHGSSPSCSSSSAGIG
jgi:hypothetical protein